MTTMTPRATATREPGTRGRYRRRPRTSARDRNPTTNVGQWVSPRAVTSPQSFSKKLPEAASTPNSLGSWPMMIVSARPTMNPLSTGSEMNPARKPNRSSPAIIATTPVTIASAAVRAT